MRMNTSSATAAAIAPAGAGNLSVEIAAERVLLPADARAWLFDLKPRMRGALVHAPASGMLLDQLKPPPAQVLDVTLANRTLKPGAFVDDLN